jgi:hypothetical protein
MMIPKGWFVVVVVLVVIVSILVILFVPLIKSKHFWFSLFVVDILQDGLRRLHGYGGKS